MPHYDRVLIIIRNQDRAEQNQEQQQDEYIEPNSNHGYIELLLTHFLFLILIFTFHSFTSIFDLHSSSSTHTLYIFVNTHLFIHNSSYIVLPTHIYTSTQCSDLSSSSLQFLSSSSLPLSPKLLVEVDTQEMVDKPKVVITERHHSKSFLLTPTIHS